jgi:hypothetical protein
LDIWTEDSAFWIWDRLNRTTIVQVRKAERKASTWTALLCSAIEATLEKKLTFLIMGAVLDF